MYSGNHVLVDVDTVEDTTVQLGPVFKVSPPGNPTLQPRSRLCLLLPIALTEGARAVYTRSCLQRLERTGGIKKSSSSDYR